MTGRGTPGAIRRTRRETPKPSAGGRCDHSLGPRPQAPVNNPLVEHMGGLLHLGQHPGLALAHEGVQVGSTAPVADFDFTKYDIVLPLLNAVPHENRTGAIAKGEKNLPVRQAMYALVAPDRARRRHPDSIWNMGARAGSATEARSPALLWRLSRVC
jgi:hypothetical protein